MTCSMKMTVRTLCLLLFVTLIYSPGLFAQGTCDTYGCEQRCNDPGSGPMCSCDNGYVLDANNFTCSDKDECLAGTSGCTQNCTNTIGSFQCSCYSGYEPHPILTMLCNDINECSVDNGGCDDHCDDTEGSYICSCDGNYTLWSDGHSCDFNECDENNGGCQSLCVNTLGSYRCDCEDGFELTFDQHSCREIPSTISMSTLGVTHAISRESSGTVTMVVIVACVTLAILVVLIAIFVAVFLCKKSPAVASV